MITSKAWNSATESDGDIFYLVYGITAIRGLSNSIYLYLSFAVGTSATYAASKRVTSTDYESCGGIDKRRLSSSYFLNLVAAIDDFFDTFSQALSLLCSAKLISTADYGLEVSDIFAPLASVVIYVGYITETSVVYFF